MDPLFLTKRKGVMVIPSGGGEGNGLSRQAQHIIIGVIFGVVGLVLLIGVFCIFWNRRDYRAQRPRHRGTDEGRGLGVSSRGGIRVDRNTHLPAGVGAGNHINSLATCAISFKAINFINGNQRGERQTGKDWMV
ncbi:MAG: hypothetical protein Q9194_002597 [Teloschistes cf. exilis]